VSGEHEDDRIQQDAPEAAQEQQQEAAEAGNRALSDALKISFRFLKGAMILLVAAYLVQGLFWVDRNQIKFKMLFGRVVPDAAGRRALSSEDGLHFRWPWQDVVTITTDEQKLDLVEEFWTDEGEVQEVLNIRRHKFLVTGDRNLVHLKLRVRYQVGGQSNDVLDYAFSVGQNNAREILKRCAMAATTEVVGGMSVDQVITRSELFDRIRAQLVTNLAEFRQKTGCSLGLMVIAVEAIGEEGVKNPTVPEPVLDAFHLAQSAHSSAETQISEGTEMRTRILNEGMSEANAIKGRGETGAMRLVKSAESDAEFLASILKIREDASPERREQVMRVLREQLYLRAVEDVLIASPGSIVLHEPEAGRTRELRLMLQRPFTKIRREPEH